MCRTRPLGIGQDTRRGIREFVVGTGGTEYLYEIEEPLDNVEAYNDGTYGVLELTLKADSYGWEFVPMAGRTFTDSGSTQCH